MARKSDTQDLSNLVINRVASYEVFQDMIEQGQVNENELYLIEGEAQSVTYSISKSGGTITLTGSDGSTSTVTVATKTSDLTNDSGFITSSSVPSASTTTPKMDGTASYGSGTTWARADHVHPTDTSRAAASDLSAHTGDTNNPHSVTAAQVGAASSSHTHGNLTNDGKVGSTSGYSVYTTTGGAVTSGTLATSDPTASGTATSFIATASQDAKGKMTLTKAGLPTASSSTAGITTVGASGGAAAYSHGTHVTYSTTAPAMDDTAAAGSASTVARSDHVHPTDTSRAAASDLSAHTGDTNNPHSVTAAQVGAASSSHTHGNLTNDGKVGSTSGYSVYTTTGGAVTSGTLATSDPTASGTATSFIATASQDAKGKMTLTKASLPTASSTVSGITTVGASGGAAAYSHGTHVSYSTTAPVMDGTAAVGSASTVARSDHVHPTDTSRAASSHNHAASNITSGTLGVARGGTGLSSVTANYFLVGNGTSALQTKTAAQVLSLIGAQKDIVFGSYVGTGTYGSGNPNSITFSIAPEFIWLFAIRSPTASQKDATKLAFLPDPDSGLDFISMSELTTSYVQHRGFSSRSYTIYSYAKKSSDGKTVYWYNTYGDSCQRNFYNNTLNAADVYYYLAI